MRQQNTPAHSALLFCAGLSAFILAAEQPQDEFSAAANYDEVLRDLIVNLSRDKAAAQDAALKLARLGKRSVPVLTEIFKASFRPDPLKRTAPAGDPQAAYYSAWALSRIKLADAARPLLPILSSDNAGADLKLLAIEALGIELLDEACAPLQKVASGDPDIEMRKKAYLQLTIMPNFWIKSEKLFVDALSDPDADIRAIAARQCMFARIYLTAADKLIEIAEKDSHPLARTNAMLALARMRLRKAVPALVRIAAGEDTSAAFLQQTLRALDAIAGVSLKDSLAVQNWWKKSGEAEYAKLEAPPKALHE